GRGLRAGLRVRLDPRDPTLNLALALNHLPTPNLHLHLHLALSGAPGRSPTPRFMDHLRKVGISGCRIKPWVVPPSASRWPENCSPIGLSVILRGCDKNLARFCRQVRIGPRSRKSVGAARFQRAEAGRHVGTEHYQTTSTKE